MFKERGATLAGLIVHEWIEVHGGSERVVDAMAEAFADADIFCLWNNDPGRWGRRTVRESRLAHSRLRGKKALSLPVMPLVWSRVDIAPYDWVLVSSHAFAHHVGQSDIVAPPRFVYVHTPARYLWAGDLDPRGQGPGARVGGPLLRALDRRRARKARGTNYAANSEFIRERIRQSWGVEASVVYPPVDVRRLQSVADWSTRLTDEEQSLLAVLPENFLMGASRFVEYKRLDVVIRAGKVTHRPVVLAGSGPDEARLRELASSEGVDVTFVERPSDSLLYAMIQRAAVFVFPPIEDFGILPVEAMALGTPVVVNGQGGARESVEMVAGGAVLPDLSDESLASAVGVAASIDMQGPAARAMCFSTESFTDRLRAWMRLARNEAT